MNEKFIDEYKNQHIKDEELGRGGQGVVFRTKDPDLAIKVVTEKDGKEASGKEEIDKYRNRFKRVRLLPIPRDLNISLPLALLDKKPGYVMQLLSDMNPFSSFWPDTKAINDEEIPKWLGEAEKLKEEEKDGAKTIVHYMKTGGLRRRLCALYKCACLLARLHGAGLVYGDISPHNIFVSNDFDNPTVWLIDSDNIRFEVDEKGSVVWTPKYGAPELVQAKGFGTSYSDCHAFAVVAFYILSLIHPFIGKKVDGGGWDDEDGEGSEDDAYAGLFPWVEDRDDDSNSSKQGLPRQLVITRELADLFERTFNQGRLNPPLRPTIYHWPSALAEAADAAIVCGECSMSFYYHYVDIETKEHSCPYCEKHRPQIIVLESYRWKGPGVALDSPCWRYVREISSNSKVLIPRRVFDEFRMTDSDVRDLSILLKDEKILIKNLNRDKYDISIAVDSAGEFKRVASRQIEIDLKSIQSNIWMFAKTNSPRLVRCTIVGDVK